MNIRQYPTIIAGIAALILILAAPGYAAGERVTFYKDVLPIIQENCQDCHRPAGQNVFGMVAPMSFMSYAEVRPWAKSIAQQVQAGTMPPWHASDEFHGTFNNERTLTDAEIETIVSWAQTGAARGNPTDAPETRAFKDTDGWSIGEPDLVVTFDEPFFVEDDVEDLYQVVPVKLTKEQMPEDKWVQAFECRPGSESVHHIVLFQSAPGAELEGDLEEDDFRAGMIGGVGPGTDPTVFPEGYGRKLKSEATIAFQMHYHKESGPGTGVWDQSSVAFVFQDKPVHHSVEWTGVSSDDFEIPPRHSNWKVGASDHIPHDGMLMAVFPHMHLRGNAARYTAYYPDGTAEVLLDVPQYDFNWQTNYVLKEPKPIPAGTRLEVEMWYTNDAERAELSGINPERAIRNGGPTTDEMMIGFLDFAQPIEAGD